MHEDKTTAPDPIAEAANRLTTAGCSVLPIMPGISKRPAVSSWREYQQDRPRPDELARWFAPGHEHGIGVVCGAISGNLELTEIEGRALDQYPAIRARLQAEHTELWEKLQGWVELSPSGGIHWLYRLTGPVPGNTKIASRPSTDDELAEWIIGESIKADRMVDEQLKRRRHDKLGKMTGADVPQVLAETRGEGGFVVVAPTSGKHHETGVGWLPLSGSCEDVLVLSPEERATFHELLHDMLDTMPAARAARPARPAPVGASTVQPVERPARPAGGLFDRLSPLDDYEARHDWADILLPHGWTLTREDTDGTRYWLRPGSDGDPGRDHSATTGHAGDRDRLYVFSTSTEFDTEVPYTKVGALAVLEYGGDHKRMAEDLAGKGYGSGPVSPVGPAPQHPLSAPQSAAQRVEVSAPAPGAESAPQAAAAPAEQWSELDGAGLTAAEIEAEYIAHHAAQRRLDMLAAEQARRMIAAEQVHVDELPRRRTLRDRLAEPRPEIKWRIDGMWPVGGRVNLVAAPKTGKTTTVTNIVRSLVEGEQFLDTFDVDPVPAGPDEHGPRVVVFDFEMTEGQLLDWYERQNLANPELVDVIPMRGYASSFDFLTPETRDKLVKLYGGAHTYVLDPVGPVLSALGLEENSNSEVQRLLTLWDEFVRLMGGSESIVVVHAGHNGERARGASAFLGSGDAIWTLVREKADEGEIEQPARFLKAVGRGVDLPETELKYDPRRGRLTMGELSRAESKQERAAGAAAPYVLAALEQYGESTPTALWAAVKNSGQASEWDVGRDPFRQAFKLLEKQGAIVVTGTVRNASTYGLTGRQVPLGGEDLGGEHYLARNR